MNLFKKKSRVYFERLYALVMKSTFNKSIRYSILLMLFYLLHEDSHLLHTYAKGRTTYFTATETSGLQRLFMNKVRFYDREDMGLSIPKGHRGSEAAIDAYLTLSFKRFYQYFKAIQAIEDPLSNSLSGSAEKLLHLYLNEKVVAPVEDLKKLLRTRTVAKQAAATRKRSHS